MPHMLASLDRAQMQAGVHALRILLELCGLLLIRCQFTVRSCPFSALGYLARSESVIH